MREIEIGRRASGVQMPVSLVAPARRGTGCLIMLLVIQWELMGLKPASDLGVDGEADSRLCFSVP